MWDLAGCRWPIAHIHVFSLVRSFFYKTVYPHVQIKAARFLTMFQMGQFVLGPSVMIWHAVADTSACIGPGADVVLRSGGIYTLGLLILFAQFYLRKYTNKSSGKKKSV